MHFCSNLGVAMALPELLYHSARVVWTGLFFFERAWITSFVEFACLGAAAPNSRHHVLENLLLWSMGVVIGLKKNIYRMLAL